MNVVSKCKEISEEEEWHAQRLRLIFIVMINNKNKLKWHGNVEWICMRRKKTSFI